MANWRSCNRDRRFRLHSCELFQAGDFVRPALFDGGFQDQRNVVETFVGGDPFEARPADMAVAEGHVTIDAAAERFGRIVEVHAAEVAKTHRAVDQGEGALACLGGAQVVAGGEGVAGVDAEPYSRLILDAVDDIGQLLECEAEVGALSRSVFDNGRNAACRVERYVDRLGDAVERLYLRNFCKWLPGWKLRRSSPSASQRFISSRNDARDFSRASRSGWPRLIR